MSLIKKLGNRYTSMSEPIKASLWFTVCSILQKGITLLSTPIFTRLLTTEEYGVYSVYQSWYFIINILATLNLYAGVYNTGMTKYSDDRPQFTSSMLGLSSCLTALLFIVYVCFESFWTSIFKLSPIFIYAMFLEFLFAPAYSFWSAEQRYDYKYKKLVIITLFLAIASPVLGVISVLVCQDKAAARVLSYVAVQVFIGIILYIHIIKKSKTFFHKDYWKYGLAFNIPLIPHYLSTMILNQSDRLMINNMIGTGEAAIYSVAYQVAMMMTIVTTAINNSFVPYSFKEFKEKRVNGVRRTASVLLVFIGLSCFLAIAFGPEIILIFASKDYHDAIWVIPPVAISVYFMFLYPLFANVEFYFEKTKFVAVASSLAAILNLVLNYIFIPIFGYYAAGYTTLVSYIVYSFAHMFFYKRITAKEMNGAQVYNLKFILLFSLFLLVGMVGLTATYYHMIIRYAVILTLIVLALWKRNIILEQLKEIRGK